MPDDTPLSLTLPAATARPALDARGFALLLATAASFAASPTLNKALAEALDPLLLAFLRGVVATPVLWALVGVSPAARAARVGFGAPFLLGLLLVAIPFGAMAWGLQRIESGLAGILYGAMPLFVAGFAWALLPGEKPGPRAVAGLVVGLAGVALVIGPEAVIHGLGRNLAFELAALLSPLSYALGVVALRRLRSVQPLRLTAAMVTAATLALAPFAALSRPEAVLTLDAGQWFALVALATVATALPAWLNQRLVAAAGAVNASLVMFVMPPLAVLFGWLAFGEALGPFALGGMALIAVAGLLVTRSR